MLYLTHICLHYIAFQIPHTYTRCTYYIYPLYDMLEVDICSQNGKYLFCCWQISICLCNPMHYLPSTTAIAMQNYNYTGEKSYGSTILAITGVVESLWKMWKGKLTCFFHALESFHCTVKEKTCCSGMTRASTHVTIFSGREAEEHLFFRAH